MLARALVLAALLGGSAWPARATVPAATQQGMIRGTVVEARTGHPLAGVQIRLSGTDQATNTDESGRYRLDAVGPGHYVLVVSVVGYALVRRAIDVAPGADLVVDVTLAEGVGTYEERVDVVAARAARREDATVAETSIGGAELLNLRGLVADDPLRAVQAMPAVASTDDFSAEISARGSGPGDIGITLDGVPASSVLLHSVEGRGDSGSIARINSDALERATFQLGSYPQRQGGHLGAQLDLVTRQGSRDRLHVRGVASTVTAALVAEGPLPASRGSWLVSIRQSYVDWIIRSLDEDNTNWLNFTDGLARFDVDLSPRHQASLVVTGGRSRLEDKVENPGVNSLRTARSTGGLVIAGLRSQGASWLLNQQAFVLGNQFRNAREDGADLGDGRRSGVGYRIEGRVSPGTATTVEFGAQLERLGERQVTWTYDRRKPGQRSADERVDEAWMEAGAHGQVTWAPGSTTTIVGGARVDHDSLTGSTTGSPWMQLRQALGGHLSVVGGTGIYRQLPLALEVGGVHGGGVALTPEKAWHIDAGIEAGVGPYTRWRASAFSREERRVIWAEGLEARLVGGAVVVPRPHAVFENRLEGTSRGFELVWERRDPNRVSGWVGYAYAHTRYRDVPTGETFDGDWDQRHTLNAYGSFRLTSNTMAVVRYRFGSNVPLRGYYEDAGDVDSDGLPIFVYGTARNAARLPAYSRLDLRVNHAFPLGNRRVTIFVELINVTNRTNGGPTGGRRVEKLLPFVPAAGLLVEF